MVTEHQLQRPQDGITQVSPAAPRVTGHTGQSDRIVSWLWGRCLCQDSVVPEC